MALVVPLLALIEPKKIARILALVFVADMLQSLHQALRRSLTKGRKIASARWRYCFLALALWVPGLSFAVQQGGRKCNGKILTYSYVALLNRNRCVGAGVNYCRRGRMKFTATSNFSVWLAYVKVPEP